MEELSSYNPKGLIVGVLGGGKGTTRDTFELVRQSEKIWSPGRSVWKENQPGRISS